MDSGELVLALALVLVKAWNMSRRGSMSSVGVDADAGVIACLRGAIYMIRE